MAATIKDIARLAKVSMNTVSRALNEKPDVNAETSKRILKIAQELNYSPNTIARSLVSKKTRILGVVVTDNANPFYAQVLKGIEDTALQRRYNIILCNSDENSQKEQMALQLLREKRIDGILITPVQKDKAYIIQLKELNIPFVLLNRYSKEIKTDYVINDNTYGAQLAVEHLIDIGRRKIAYIGGPSTISSVQERLEGCHKALKNAGLSVRDLVVEHTNLKMEDGYFAMKKLLKNPAVTTGVFAYSDLLSIGAMKAIKEAGLHIPEDIALVGYDDIDLAEFLETPLTTVRQPRYEIGKKATNILINKLEGIKSIKHKCIVLRPELIIRKSA